MTQHLDHLKLSLSSIRAEIHMRRDNMNRMKWELDELEHRQAEIEKEIEQAKLAHVNPCLERVL